MNLPHDQHVARYARDLDALLTVSRAMTGERDLTRLLAIILDAAKGLCQADRCSIFIADHERQELWTQVAQASQAIRIPMDSGIAGQVFTTGQPISLADAHDHPAFNAANDLASGYRTRSMLCLPLIGRDGRPVGVLQALNKNGGDEVFAAYDEHVLGALCSQAAVAIETAQLVERDLQRQRLAREMQLAQEIQQSLLPCGMPDLPGWRFHAWQRPCDETGGDYHDFLPGAGAVDVVVGDVSGHGLGAAILMSTARASLRALHPLVTGLDDLLSRLNGLLVEDLADDAFMTLLFCRVGGDGSLAYVSGGHEPPLVYRAAAGRFDDLHATGLLVGAVPGVRYEVVCIDPPLARGDLVVAFTDGIFEAAAPSGEAWGIERLQRVIAANAAGGPEAVCAAVIEAVGAHAAGAPPQDDMTLVVAERTA